MATNQITTKGSLWRKWDFHLHSPSSILSNGYGNPEVEETWEKYVTAIEKIAKEKEIAAIGITDYFTIDGYKKVKEYKDKGRLQGILIFPNIEFRASNFITVQDKEGRKETSKINFHVLFSSDVPVKDIEEDFLHEIDFLYQENPSSSAYPAKLKTRNLQEFGNKLKAEHPPFEGKSDLVVGCENAVVEPHEVKKTLEKKAKFKGKYLICLAEDKTSDLDWNSQAHSTRKLLIQMSHCIFSSNCNTRNVCLGKSKENSPEKFKTEFVTLKPCIWGCDSHSYNERFLEPDKNNDGKINFCWVKGDLTWEGLRQILYEPEERVRIQQESPETQKSIHTIDKISIQGTEVNKNLRIKETNVDLNYNLISIIGGKGTGKTAFLDIIASCFREGNASISSSSLSFYKRLYDKAGNNPIKLKLSTKYKENAIEKNVGLDASVIEDANIRYITQNHFEAVSSPSNNLNTYVFDLLFEKYQDELREFKERSTSIVEKQRQIESVNLLIEQLSQEIDKVGALTQEKERKNGDKIDCEQRIKDIEDKGVDSKLNELTDALTKKREERKDIESAQKRLTRLKQHVKQLRNIEQQIVDFNDEFVEKLGLKPFSAHSRLGNERIAKMEEIINYNVELLGQKLKPLTDEIDDIYKNLESFKDTNKTLSELKQKLITTTEDIKILEKQINEIKEKEKEQNELTKELFDNCIQMINENIAQASFLNKHIKTFESGNNELLTNIKFKVGSTVDFATYCENLYDVIDKRSISEEELARNLNKSIINPVNLLLETSKLDYDELKNGFCEIENYLKPKLRKKSSNYDLKNALFKVPINTSFNITFDEKPLEKLSMGQRAIVLLQIILAYDDKPLLIDQPEEALDNVYIYDQLVSAFRNAKKKRQIIIATHNANLVVNTDSEQIIIANYKNDEISYSVGTIENPPTQELIKKILEGGKEAFERREEKYGYKL
ncbi:MAG: TrlF family AAA-like ATPase [Candidatus Bathyarchaeia archaeon]|jgi:ABC-type cobalamin/Fe3+-siderophores transport system ATPase subunit